MGGARPMKLIALVFPDTTPSRASVAAKWAVLGVSSAGTTGPTAMAPTFFLKEDPYFRSSDYPA